MSRKNRPSLDAGDFRSEAAEERKQSESEHPTASTKKVDKESVHLSILPKHKERLSAKARAKGTTMSQLVVDELRLDKPMQI